MKIEAEIPCVAHEVAPDGLSIHSYYLGKDGRAASSVFWDDIDTATMNYVNAARAFESRVPALQDKMREIGSGTSESRLKRGDRWDLYTNTGKPVWWLPRFGVRRKDGLWRFRGGWLLWCATLEQHDRKKERVEL